jgi:tetratricopeptide (TPR) repeat protein
MRILVAIALLAACRGDSKKRHDAGRAPASGVSGIAASPLPTLPRSPDGNAEVKRLEAELALAKAPNTALPLALALAKIRGRVEDYQDALARSQAWLAAKPDDLDAIRTRVRALTGVHKFTEARALLARIPANQRLDLEVTLEEATGHLETSAPAREANAKAHASTQNLVAYAASLGVQGKIDDALALMPRAAAALHDNAPELISWLLFQWGRLYELDGKPAQARPFFAEAHRRLPGSVEATVHLAQAMIATGEDKPAHALVEAALAENRHPELLAFDHPDEATREWERYVAALPEAFSDHAARFYLTRDPSRALVLARANLANRDTPEARALVAEAALAAGDAASACAVVEPLIHGPAARAQRFIAWRALAKCGRTEDADRLARDLGITR